MTPRPVRVGTSVGEAVPALLEGLREAHAGEPVAVIVGLLVRDASAGRMQPRFRWLWQSCQLAALVAPRSRLYSDAASALRSIAEQECDA
jgi:hypothetical protein